MWRKTLPLILIILLVEGALIQNALGQKYPTKPIEIIVPNPAGSFTDLASRLVADTAQKYLGQPLIAVNKAGAGGSTAAAEVITSRPDGYKLYAGFTSYFATGTKTMKIPFDPKHLTPLVNFLEQKDGLVVRGDSPWKALSDLLDYAKKNPVKLTWGHTGRSAINYINVMLIFRKAGIETTDIPYKGSPEKLAALLGGHVAAATMPYGPSKDLVDTGKIRYLFFSSDRRYSEPADVPCAAELGFPGKLKGLFGFYVHKDTPEEVRKTLFAAFKKTYEDPEFRTRLEKFGEEPRFGDAEFMKEEIRKGEEVGVPILKELGLFVER